MASPRSLRWASAAAGLGAVAFALASLLALWRSQAPAPPPRAPVDAAPPSAAPPGPPPLASADATLAASRRAYLAAVMRTPGPGASSREIAADRHRVFDEEVARLAALGPEAAPFLLASLEAESNDHARLLLLTALSRVGGDAGMKGTLAALEALKDPTLEPLFIDRLVRADDPASETLLEAVLRDSPRPETRASVLASAARRGDTRLAARLPELALRDDSPLVRAQALATAEQLGAPLPPGLLEQLAHSDADPAVRERAIDALAASDATAFVGYARRALGVGTDTEHARAITLALARSSDPAAGALLDELSRSSDAAVRDAASRALRSRSAPKAAR